MTLRTIGWHASQEGACGVGVGLLDGKEKTHTELGGPEHAGARINHFKYHTGMQQTKRGNLSWSDIGQHKTTLLSVS